MKKTFALLLLTSIFMLNCNSKDKMNIDNSYIDNFELDRYLGTWYEIARFPHSFEKGLVGVTAKYSMRADGKVKVENSGYKNSLKGERSSSIGKAKMAGAKNEGYLKVSFFLFFYADYRILELDTINYQYALIGSSSSKYLWILSRTPMLPDSIYNELVRKAAERGYDTTKLGLVEQKSLMKFNNEKTI